jgi:protein CpxP
MTTNKIFTAAAVLALSASLAVAAPHGNRKGFGGHGKGRGEFGARFAEKLNLTDAQKSQMRDLNKGFREQNKAFFEQVRQTRQDLRAAKQANDTARVDALKGTAEAQRTQMKQLHDTQKQRILSVLTPEQRQQYEALKADRAARRQNRG